MTTKTASKRTAPRKAVAKVGGTRASELPPTSAAGPERFTESTGPYGTKNTYTFTPADGGEPIVFPHITEVQADAYFFWKIYELNEMFQAFEWMNKAGVPRAVQERVMRLPDAEKSEFFSGWFGAVIAPQGVAPPGES